MCSGWLTSLRYYAYRKSRQRHEISQYFKYRCRIQKSPNVSGKGPMIRMVFVTRYYAYQMGLH